MDYSVRRMPDLSASMDVQLARLFQRSRRAGDPRVLVTMAPCEVALEHGRAQRILIEAGCQATFVATAKHKPAFAAYYAKLVASGRRKKVALVAEMHKALTILNAFAKSGKHWDVSMHTTRRT